MKSTQEAEHPYVFDPRTCKFFLMESKKLLQQFMDTYYPDIHYDINRGKLDMKAIRQVSKE